MGYEANIQEMQKLTGKIRTIPMIDATLTKEGCAADAKAIGDRLAEITQNSFGDYSGNGNTAQRVIGTGGIGRVLLVYNIYYLSFVTHEGAMVITLADGSIRWLERKKAFFNNGNLTLSTDNAAFNTANTTYYYQVI